MITEKRHELILRELSKREFLSLQELVEKIGCSTSTIRRDLSKLQTIGKLTRVHGGAKLNQSVVLEPNLTDKRRQNLQEKQEIGRFAATFIQDNDCVFLDAGSTTLEMIPYIEASDITVVTNGLTHIEELLKQGIKTLTLGGEVKPTTFATVGPNALASLQRYRFDKAFIGMNGIDLKYGLTTPDEQEGLIKREAMNYALNTFIVADTSKFHKVYFAHVPMINEATILTSQAILQLETYEMFSQHYRILGGAR